MFNMADGRLMLFMGGLSVWRSTASAPPANLLPGVVGQLSSGFHVPGGSPWDAGKQQIFDWTYDSGQQVYFNGKQYSYPDQLTITIQNRCDLSVISTSSMGATLDDTLRSEAEGHSTTLGMPKVDISVDIPDTPVSLSTSIQNQIMFGSSSSAAHYRAAFQQGLTKSALATSQATVYRAQLSTAALHEGVFNANFKTNVLAFCDNPTKAHALQFFEAYGTHFVQTADLGGEFRRSFHFDSFIDNTAASDFVSGKKESGLDFWFIHNSKQQASTESIQSSTGQTGSVLTTGTEVIGGDPSATSGGDFCKSLSVLFTPVIMKYKKLLPIYNFLHLVNGTKDVAKAASIMKKTFLDYFRLPDAQCDLTGALCTWSADSQKWLGSSCECLSRTADPSSERYGLMVGTIWSHPEKEVFMPLSWGFSPRGFTPSGFHCDGKTYAFDLADDCAIFTDGGRIDADLMIDVEWKLDPVASFGLYTGTRDRVEHRSFNGSYTLSDHGQVAVDRPILMFCMSGSVSSDRLII